MDHCFEEQVAIFWDYENCTPPCSTPGYDVVNNIREAAHTYGSVKLFKAYLELSEQSSSKAIGLRSELQSCGVSLTDCPHNGRKDVADKMIIVDMLTYAIDNPAPATIVLISGDRDFVYAISVLRLRKYRVVIVAPKTAHTSLKCQASVVLDWDTDIMRKTTVRTQTLEASRGIPDDALLRSPRRPPLSFGGPLPQPAAKHARRPSFKATTPLTPVTPLDVNDGVGPGHLFQSRHFRNPSIVTTDETHILEPIDQPMAKDELTDSGLRFMRMYDGSDKPLSHSPIPDIVEIMRSYGQTSTSVTQPHGISQPNMNVSILESTTGSAIGLLCVNGSVSDSTAGLSDARVEKRPPTPIVVPEDNSSSSSDETKPVVAPAPSIFPTLDYAPPLVRPATVEALLRIRSGSPQSSSPSLTTSPTSSEEDITGPSDSEGPLPDGPSDGPSSAPPLAALNIDRKSSPVAPAAMSHVTSPTPQTLKSPQPQPTSTHPELDAITPSSPDSVKSTPELDLSAIPAYFHHLMKVLELARLRGSEKPLRSWVGLQLPKGTYDHAKVKAFKQYTLAAEKAGVVVLGGGVQAAAWVALSPAWHGKVPVSVTA